MTKANPTSGIETKWDILMGHIQMLRHKVFIKNIKVLQWLSKSNFLSFMTKVNPSNGNETKSDIFDGTYSTLRFFLGHKSLKYFTGFYNWHLSVSFQK